MAGRAVTPGSPLGPSPRLGRTETPTRGLSSGIVTTRWAARPTPAQWSAAAVTATPGLFVLIWATGFVVAKFVTPYAEPLSFLTLRYVGVIVLMLVLALAAGARWPRGRQVLHLAVAGVGIHAGYLGGVWAAVAAGMPAGVAALVVNLQPVLTAAFAAGLLGERLGRLQVVGLLLGFAGVVLVVSSKLTTDGLSPLTLGLTTMALLTITAGTLYQKHFCPDFDLRTGQVVQFGASIVVTLPFALVFESFRLDWTPQLIGAFAWSVLVLTGGGISLLFLMLRRGAAAKVTSYFYLVPGITALLAWVMFGETLGPLAIAGMVVAVLGVALATRSPRSAVGGGPGGDPERAAPTQPEGERAEHQPRHDDGQPERHQPVEGAAAGHPHQVGLGDVVLDGHAVPGREAPGVEDPVLGDHGIAVRDGEPDERAGGRRALEHVGLGQGGVGRDGPVVEDGARESDGDEHRDQQRHPGDHLGKPAAGPPDHGRDEMPQLVDDPGPAAHERSS